MKDIPEAPPQRAKLTDDRVQTLQNWKKLFEEIDPKIEVFLKEDTDFKKILSREFEHVDLRSHNSIENVEMIVSLPIDFICSFVLFLKMDISFSEKDINDDYPYFQANRQVQCLPETNTWEGYYNKIYEEKERMIRGIPPVPKKKKALS